MSEDFETVGELASYLAEHPDEVVTVAVDGMVYECVHVASFPDALAESLLAIVEGNTP